MSATGIKRIFPAVAAAILLGTSSLGAQQNVGFLSFDGANDYGQVADADSLSFGNGTTDTPLTFETWLRPVGIAAKQNIIGKWSDGSMVEYRLYIAANTIRIDLGDASSGATVSAFTNVGMAGVPNNWHHLAVTYDGRGGASAANGITFYLDGLPLTIQRQNNPAYVAMENTSLPIQIGREGPSYKQYNGALDELRLWNVARTSSEIQSHMSAELDAPEPGLIAYWKFNEGAGTTVADAALGTNPIALFNSPTWLTGGPIGPSTPDTTPPVISNIGTANLTDTSVTIQFTTDEPTTGTVFITSTGACPCTELADPNVGTSHSIAVTGLVQDTAYTFHPRATDAADNETIGPDQGFRTLVTPADSTPPTVSIVNPQAGTVSGSIVITANASDNIGVAGVQFRIDGVNFGAEDTAPPYSIAWDTGAVAEGSHTISAVARDSANNSATANVIVSVSATPPPTQTPWYLEFDGANDYLSVNDADALSFGNGLADAPFTFEFWFRPVAIAAAKQNLLTKWQDPSNVEYRLYIGGNTLRLDLRDGSAGATMSAYPMPGISGLQGSWHHAAVIYDGRGGSGAANGITFLIDGLPVTVTREINPAYVAMENTARPLEIGREGPNYKQFLGGLDDIRIWNVARTQEQIQANMNTELTTPQFGLVAYWKFNEGSGVSAEDAAGAHAATLFNGPAWTAGGPISAPSDQAPAITSANATTMQAGVTGSFTVTATGHPTPTIERTGALPSGVTFADHADGTAGLGGTPAAGTGGSYPLTFTATNGVGQPAAQTFSLNVNQPPSITSAAATTFQSGTPGTFTVTAAGFPSASLSASGAMPSGVLFTDNGNGTATIAGTAAANAGGVYPLTITATNGVTPLATQNFALTINQAPVITSGAAVALQVNVPNTFTVTATGYPTPALSLSGTLPSGVSFVDNGNRTATISGTPALGSGGDYPVTITAQNGISPNAIQNLIVSVPDCVITPPAGSITGGTFGVPYSFAFGAFGGTAHTFALTSGSVASGLSISSAGVLSGTPTATGSFVFTVTASNSTGCNASNSYTLLISPNAVDEAFSNAVGNTQYSVGAGAPATPAVVVSGTVLSNDHGIGTLTAGPAAIITANGGTVAMSSAGNFLYTPPAGFAGPSDSFTYTLTDGNGTTDTAVVTINMGSVVWYLNGAATAGDGRSSSPFNSLTAASAAAQTGHIIYVHSGTVSGALILKPGQTLWGAGAAFTLNALTIPQATPPTLSGSLSLADNVSVRAVTINGGAGTAISASGLSGTELLDGVSITGGATGFDLTNLGGTFTVIGGSITGVASGTDVRITGGSGNIAIGSDITNTGGRSIDVQQRTGGSVTFSGAINDTGAGILLNANGGSSIAFAGGLTLSTTTNPAFTATNGGTVTVTQDNVAIVNTITTTSATALTVTNTEIGAAGLTFRRISAGTSTLSAGAGIILDSTGMSAMHGGLTITGNGTAQSGGIIRRKTGADGSLTSGVGISLVNTKNPSFSWLELSRFDNSAIVGRNVAGFTIANSLIADSGNNVAATEGPIVFGLPGIGGANGLVGAGVIRDTVVSGAFKDSVAFYNQSDTMSLVVERTGPTPGQCQVGLSAAATGGHGIVVQLEGTATGSVTVNRCRFRDVRQASIVAAAADNAQLHLLVTGSATTGSLKTEFVRTSSGQAQDGVVLTNSGNGVVTAIIENANFGGYTNSAIRMGQQAGNASTASLLEATITGNLFEMSSNGNAGGIIGNFSSSPGQQSRTRVLFANNHVNQYSLAPAVSFQTANDDNSPQVDLTLSTNHIDLMETSPGSGLRGAIGTKIEALRGAVCSNLTNNISHYVPVGLSPQGGGIRLLQGGSAVFALEQGTQTLGTAAATVLAANNPAPLLSVMVTEALGTINVVPNGSCVVPAAP